MLPKATSTGLRKQPPTHEAGTAAPATWSALRAPFPWVTRARWLPQFLQSVRVHALTRIRTTKDSVAPTQGRAEHSAAKGTQHTQGGYIPRGYDRPTPYLFCIAVSAPSLLRANCLCLPGRPICFMHSKYRIRARVDVLFPHQYGMGGHSSQCFPSSTSSSYETIT